jgi:hypothetical protein
MSLIAPRFDAMFTTDGVAVALDLDLAAVAAPDATDHRDERFVRPWTVSSRALEWYPAAESVNRIATLSWIEPVATTISFAPLPLLAVTRVASLLGADR